MLSDRICSFFRLWALFFFSQNNWLASYLWWRRFERSRRWPAEVRPPLNDTHTHNQVDDKVLFCPVARSEWYQAILVLVRGIKRRICWDMEGANGVNGHQQPVITPQNTTNSKYSTCEVDMRLKDVSELLFLRQWPIRIAVGVWSLSVIGETGSLGGP